jgi:polyhydroxyalkanoate synthesis regulator phasin
MGLSDLVQKAVYIGIGAASYAGEKAGSKLTEFSGQLQKLADEMVERGEMTAEEARRYVDEKMKAAQVELENLSQQAQQQVKQPPTPETPKEPRRIEIIDEDETRKPEVTKPEVTKPEATKPEATKPEATKPEPAKPETTKPEPAKPESSGDPIEDMRRQVAELQDELKRLRS